jgi:hypothetical protein
MRCVKVCFFGLLEANCEYGGSGIHKLVHTSGTKGGVNSLFSRISQSIDWNHGCRWSSSKPSDLGLQANRFEGSRSRS